MVRVAWVGRVVNPRKYSVGMNFRNQFSVAGCHTGSRVSPWRGRGICIARFACGCASLRQSKMGLFGLVPRVALPRDAGSLRPGLRLCRPWRMRARTLGTRYRVGASAPRLPTAGKCGLPAVPAGTVDQSPAFQRWERDPKDASPGARRGGRRDGTWLVKPSQRCSYAVPAPVNRLRDS